MLYSEDIVYQERAIAVYQQLVALSLPETRAIYDSFLRFANHHFEVISEFGRFPQRNAALGRKTTDSELIYLRENDLVIEIGDTPPFFLKKKYKRLFINDYVPVFLIEKK